MSQSSSVVSFGMLLLLGAFTSGCSDDTATTTGGSGASTGSSASAGAPASGGASSSGSGGASSSGSGGASSAGSSSSSQTPLDLPFYVNAPGNFVKSGFMGDAMSTVLAAPSETDTDGTCGDNRAPGAGGDCDTFTIAAMESGEAWQGVFYQFPSNNWGDFPGRTIASGAASVTFSARASRSVAVQFQVGMCDPADSSKCADGFYAFADDADEAGKVTVGTSWSEITISLADVDYSGGVRGALSWSIANDDLLGDLSELELYLDDISWK